MDYIEAFEPKLVNSNYICYRVNSLSLGGLRINNSIYDVFGIYVYISCCISRVLYIYMQKLMEFYFI